MRVLEVSLRKAGFSVTTAVSVQDALDKLELDAPDLIISETTFADGDGFELRRRVRTRPEWGEIPFIFLTAEAAIENKIKGLELGVDDYLTKPIYIKEIITRINILLQKRQRTRFEERRDGRTRFAGRVADMPVVDVIQTIEISRKSGVIQFVGERNRQAAIYFRDGRVIDAEAGALQGEDAVYRLLTWSEGDFEVVFRTVRRREVISTSSQGLLMEGMRRLDEWSRLLEQLPPLSHRFEVDAGELATRLGDVPDDNNPILRLIDGRRTLLEVIDSSDVGDLECLQAISRLYFEEMLIDLDHGAPTRRDTGKTMPLVEVETPTPIEASASGPTADSGRLASTADLVAAMKRDVVPEPAPIDSHSGAFVRPSAEEIQSSQIESSEDVPPEPARASRDSGEQIGDEDIEEVHAEPGALEGSYRPSSLRLIDEAVAAAQAIEPSLFEDEDSTRSHVEPAQRADDDDVEEVSDASVTFVAVPEPVEDDDDESRPLTATPIGREESGLKMIGSLGRDRAQTSGEVMLPGPATGRATTERELVTILPRRITRENPVVVSPDTPTEESTVDAPLAKPVEPPKRPPPPNARSSFERIGSGVRRQTGPGRGAMALLALAGVLAVVAVYLYVTRPAKRKGKVTPDAGEVIGPVVTPIADAHPLADAELDALAIDAAGDASSPKDAVADATKVAGDGGDDPIARAKELYDQAYAALEDGSFEKALELVEQSLKLRRTARSYLLRAQAMQRLGRVDEALKSLEQAEQTFPIPAVYEARARILKAAGRNDEAREAILKYLEMVPDRGPVVKLFKQWLEELH